MFFCWLVTCDYNRDAYAHIYNFIAGPAMFVRTDNSKKTSKKAKNNQHRQGRLILFVQSSYYRCVCIINERSLSNRYCSWFVTVRVPGEIDGQVNNLSSALFSALLRRRLKNYNMRFDRKKRFWPACLVVVSEFILNIYICMHLCNIYIYI